MANANANAGVPRGQVVHGARAYLTVAGKVVGYVATVSGGKNITFSPVNVLDSLPPEEQVPTDYSAQLSATIVKVVGASLASAGIDVPLDEIPTFQGFTLAIVDRPTGKTLASWANVKMSALSFSVSKGVLTMNQCSFVTTGMRNEDGVM